MVAPNPGRRALVLKLFGSGVIAQACGFLATAFAATRTSPEDFAIFATVTAASAVLGSVNSLAAESRVPVVDSAHARALNRAGFTSTSLFAAVCAAAGIVGWRLGQTWGEVALLTSWCSFMLGVQHLLIGVVLRTQRQELLAINRLVQGIVNAVLIVAFVLAHVRGHLALSLAWAISLGLGNLVLLPHIKGWKSGFQWARPADFRALFRQVHWQPVSNVLSDTVGQIPLLVLPILGAPAVSGAWALANRFLLPVVNMAQITLQPIYYGRAAALIRAGDATGFQHHRRVWSTRLTLLAIPVLIGSWICLQWLIPLLGPEWRISSLALLPACILFPAMISWLPLSQSLILSGHIRAQFAWTVAQFTVSVMPFGLVPAGVLSAQSALLAWAVLSTGGMFVHRLLQRRLTVRPPARELAPDVEPLPAD